MLKIVHFYRWDAEPNEGIDAGAKAQTVCNLKVAEATEDEARAVLRAMANSMYGQELHRWKFLPDSTAADNPRRNENDTPGTARPAAWVAYALKSDGALDLGSYLAIRFYA